MIPIRRLPHRTIVPALLVLFVAVGTVSMWNDSATFDETPHLAAGVSYIERGDFRMNPEHPPLAKVIAAVPLVALSRTGADYGSAAWTGQDAGNGTREGANEWIFGFDMLNGPREAAARRDPAVRLRPARLAMLVLGALLCLAVYGWSREMFGRDAGLLALVLAVTCPTILAHARLVATDLPAALGVTSTLWAFWRWSRAPTAARATLTGLVLGVALLLKFNCALLAPVVVALVVVAVGARRVGFARAAAGIAIVAATSYGVLWAGYGFRFAATPGPGYALDWAGLERGDVGVPAAVRFATDHRLVPEAYAYGLAYARSWAKDRVAFLDGEESIAGWYRYFPEAFLFKTRPAMMLLATWVIAAAAWRARGRSFDGWTLALPAAAFAASAVASRFNIGQRHIAPLYPLLCIAASPAAGWLSERSRRAAAAGALVVGCLLSFALATPAYLSYFNVFAGGSRGGWRHLVDSNVDWGQDLGRLARWMRAHRVTTIDLAYFGSADPRAYGIDFQKVVMFLDTYPDRPAVRPAPGDLVAVSATILQGVYLDRDRSFAREAVARGWVARSEVEAFLDRANALRARGENVPSMAAWLVSRGNLTESQRREIDAGLPAAWMDEIRTKLTPIDRVGGSIFVYRIPPGR
jgi:Dolichyl-phosphate-mannose-protein mannosyltransferase